MAIPSRAVFDQWPLSYRVGMVLRRGAYLMRRIDGESIINLYHLGSFFAEVYYNPEANHLHHCRTFMRKEELQKYAASIDLPAL